LDLKLFRTNRAYMRDVFRHEGVTILPDSHDWYFRTFETELAAGEEQYYSARTALFYTRPASPAPHDPVIGSEQRSELRGIKWVFDRRHTQYRLVISPLYDQKAFSMSDKQFLSGLFGQRLVFDYSGKNEYTSSYTNYYETSHFRPEVARDILKRTYRDLGP